MFEVKGSDCLCRQHETLMYVRINISTNCLDTVFLICIQPSAINKWQLKDTPLQYAFINLYFEFICDLCKHSFRQRFCFYGIETDKRKVVF